jgi:hypothetical protein
MVAALDPLRELDLLGRGQKVDLADVLQEELQRVGRELGVDDALFRLLRLRREVVGLGVRVGLGVERGRFRVELGLLLEVLGLGFELFRRAHAAPPRRMRNDRIATGRTHRPLGSSF